MLGVLVDFGVVSMAEGWLLGLLLAGSCGTAAGEGGVGVLVGGNWVSQCCQVLDLGFSETFSLMEEAQGADVGLGEV